MGFNPIHNNRYKYGNMGHIQQASLVVVNVDNNDNNGPIGDDDRYGNLIKLLSIDCTWGKIEVLFRNFEKLQAGV